MLLMLERELNKYQIALKTKLSHSRVYESIKILEKKKFIVGKSAGKARTGLKIKKYSLTPIGLIAAITAPQQLGEFDLLNKKRDQIASNNAELFPLFFGKWDIFKKHSIDEWLFYTFCSLTEEDYYKISNPRVISYEIGPSYSNSFSLRVFMELLESLPRFIRVAYRADRTGQTFKSFVIDNRKVFEALSNDSDIRKLIFEELARRKEASTIHDKIEKLILKFSRAPQSRGEGKGKERG